ncbi:enoyl-CoA hydratase/isomerase family protein [Gordonia aichiensis]|uniref:Putative enoyl-CoA hydratase n=1 Tax=Gordonia aichiensis NBRC 108223 TaxID=1220583 RepID=L7KML4_9ACTN|nr:enoyl-CoA hydratase-related protein [Gordonia aichiensis]GAC49197.1 putative enoyl-CoA hydratase [Gordonia aichiensis NBRC 108223]
MTLDTSTDSVNTDVKSGIATITLNRPDRRNAWDDSLGEGLESAFTATAFDDSVRCIVLTGAGSAFCSGADLAAGFPSLPSGHDDLTGTLRRRFHPGFLAMLDSPKPVIAAVNGPAIGAGACLALAADIAIMDRQHAYLQFRFSAIGLMPDVGATALLAEAVGAQRAIEIFMLAEKLGAERCAELGLVSRITDDLDTDVHELANRLASGPTAAFATTKRAVRAWTQSQMACQLELEAALQQSLIATQDWREGRSAFLEHRMPTFTGK